MTTPVEELRAAATKLRETATEATPGPWRGADTHLDVGGHTATVLLDREHLSQFGLVAWLPTFSHEPWTDGRNAWNNAAWIALASPALAEPIAVWLDRTAIAMKERGAYMGPYRDTVVLMTIAGVPRPEWEAALAVARQILGTTS